MSTVESSRSLLTSAGSASVALSLLAHPSSGVVVPIVAGVGDGAEGPLDVVPAPFVVEPATNELCDEGASPSRADPPVKVRHKLVVQSNVQTHVPSLAHSDQATAGQRPAALVALRPVCGAERDQSAGGRLESWGGGGSR